jgi:hypothetical protein
MGTATGASKGLGTELLKVAGAIAIISLSLVPLIYAFRDFLVAMVQNNITIPQVVGYLFALGGAIIFLVGVMLVLAMIAAPLAPALFIVALVMLMLGAAALLVGAGMYLAGLGIQFAAQGLMSMVGYIPQLAMMVPILFALASGFGLMGIAAGIFALTGLLAGGSLMVIAVGLTMVAGAIYVLAGALATIPDWARGLAGGILGFFGGVFGAIPRLQAGGLVERGGIAYLEPAEVVTPAGGGPGRQTVYLSGPLVSVESVRSDADIDMIAKKVDEKLRESYSRRTY